VAAGHQVWIGAHDATRGRQAADAVGARFVQLDVTDDASVTAAAEAVEELDVLVNNAGISGGRISPSEATADQMRTELDARRFDVERHWQRKRPANAGLLVAGAGFEPATSGL
jgi:NAD(P)-dependent dehydrogenase (short-subunit alcohol dehydrogenase family)